MAKPKSTEPKAKDLLPPDDPPVDDSPKRIAERRVVGWLMSDRLVTRAERRPVGNSRHFWKKIEEDDPFIPRRLPRRMREDHTLYPADRIDRIPADSPIPPKAPPKAEAPPPKPKRTAQPAVNRDPRAAKPPEHMAPPPPPEPEVPAGVDMGGGRMMPPIFAPPDPKKRSGRIKVSSAPSRPTGNTGIIRPSAEEIRAEKEAARKADDQPVFKKKSLDDVLGILGTLRMQEELHHKGLLEPAHPDEPEPPPKPTRVAKPSRVADAPAAPPKPQPEPPVDRTPPKPTPAPAAKKDPPRPSSAGGGLDDLFGGPSEGRVKIGKRAKPSGPKVEE